MATPSASDAQRAVGSSSGSPARNRYSRLETSWRFMNAVSCFLSTRMAVGELNIVRTLYSSTMRHQIAGSGRIGRPSYMMVVAPTSNGAYTMYECPTTQPMSLVQNTVSPAPMQKMSRIDAASATA